MQGKSVGACDETKKAARWRPCCVLLFALILYQNPSFFYIGRRFLYFWIVFMEAFES